MDDYDYELASETELQSTLLWRRLRPHLPGNFWEQVEEACEDLEISAEMGILGEVRLCWELRVCVAVRRQSEEKALELLRARDFERERVGNERLVAQMAMEEVEDPVDLNELLGSSSSEGDASEGVNLAQDAIREMRGMGRARRGASPSPEEGEGEGEGVGEQQEQGGDAGEEAGENEGETG